MSAQDNYFDPQMNNQPLAFNNSRGKPPMPIEDGGDRPPLGEGPGVESNMGPINNFAAKLLNIGPGKRQKSKSGVDMDNGQGQGQNMPLLPLPVDNQMGGGGMMMGGGPGYYGGPMDGQMGGQMGGQMMGAMMGGGMSPGMNPGMNAGMMGPMNQMNQMMMFGGMGGPGMPGNPGMGPQWGPMTPDLSSMMPKKEIIRLDKCVLYPPQPNAPLATTRERPPGCRTIFVGGLPETSTEEMLEEVFGNFGKTTSVRKSKKKNFAHVRFEDESSIDRALILSGYRIKVDDKDDKPNTGRLHVDFAMARDDQYEYECKQRSVIRDMRHRQRIEEEKFRPPSPPLVTQFSDYEVAMLTEQLKSDEDFMKASQVLLTWLDRGDANRRNISSFYSMIQCTNAHIRRLLSEKQGHEEELLRMKDNFRNIFEAILKQFDQIEKIFSMAQKQRNWDHFTKPQRKNIELWLKQCKEIKQSQQEEFLSERHEDEMEMSDDEDVPSKKKKTDFSVDLTSQYAEMAGKLSQINTLQDDNDALKCQVEAYRNELEMARIEGSATPAPDDKEVKSLQMALQGMQQQLVQSRNEVTELKRKADQEKANFLIEKQLLSEKGVTLERRLLDVEERERRNKNTGDGENATNETADGEKDQPKPDVEEAVISSTGLHVTDKEAKLMGLVCCFLHVHPTGASIDYIWSYLHRLNIDCRVSELETLLEKLPMIFNQELSGVGATIERRWHFTGYKCLRFK